MLPSKRAKYLSLECSRVKVESSLKGYLSKVQVFPNYDTRVNALNYFPPL